VISEEEEDEEEEEGGGLGEEWFVGRLSGVQVSRRRDNSVCILLQKPIIGLLSDELFPGERFPGIFR